MLATASSPISNHLFCNSIRCSSSSSSSSSASNFPVTTKSFQSFLSISSSSCDHHCTLLQNTSAIIRSFSSRASVRDAISSLGERLLDWADDLEAYDDGEHELENIPQLYAVVEVLCMKPEPDFSSPWEEKQQVSYGTGVIVSGRRVLTTARSVDHRTFVTLKKRNCDTRYNATMLAIAPECDLAMLTVHDDEFWKGVKPVEFGDMPSPGEKVIIPPYRNDSYYLSLMTARVSRLGMTRYSFWGNKLLAFQVKVARNGAICGGPVFDEIGKCVGMEFQSEGNKRDVMPVEVIKHFVQDYDKNGAYTGLPLLGIKWQKMESPYLREFMKMEHDQQGVLVTEVKPNYPASVIVKPYDVILSIDGTNINNDGTVPFLRGRRIEFSYLIGKKYNGDKIVIKVRRGSEIHEFITEFATHKQFVRASMNGRPLRYYIIGGFVFTTLSVPYIQFMDGRYDYKTPDEDELFSQALYEDRVVLCQVLRDDINAGCDTERLVQNQVLVTFNNKPVEGLKSLASMVEICNEEFLKFTFGNNKTLVLPTNIAKSRTPDILKAHSVRRAMSDDLKAKSRTLDILKARSIRRAMSDDLKELVKLPRGK